MRLRLVAVAAMLAACSGGGDGASGPGARFAGTYELRTLNGQPLPYRFSDTSPSYADLQAMSHRVLDADSLEIYFRSRESSWGMDPTDTTVTIVEFRRKAGYVLNASGRVATITEWDYDHAAPPYTATLDPDFGGMTIVSGDYTFRFTRD